MTSALQAVDGARPRTGNCVDKVARHYAVAALQDFYEDVFAT
jgi:hypothetical protein